MKFICILIACAVSFSALGVLSICQDENIKEGKFLVTESEGIVRTPMVKRDGYDVASVEIDQSIRAFSVVENGLTLLRQEVTVDDKRLLVVNYDGARITHRILPSGANKNIIDDFTFLRFPDGATEPGVPVKLILRNPRRDAAGITLFLKDMLTEESQQIELKKTGITADGFYDVWSTTITPTEVTWYTFYFYVYDSGKRMRVQDDDFRITVYDPDFKTPDWLKNGVIYQIFPDRFCNGNPRNDAMENLNFTDAYFGMDLLAPDSQMGLKNRFEPDWDADVRSWDQVNGECRYVGSNTFYGGDLDGIIEKLDYLEDLGVTIIYLNPIFASPSNHRYDPVSFHAVDPKLGDAGTFMELTQEAEKRDIKIILDITPDHSADDSLYFDRLGNYPVEGACEDKKSPFYPWYSFSEWPLKYSGWAGLPWMPLIDTTNSHYRDFLFSVLQYWSDLGNSGWRIDVAMNIPLESLEYFRTSLKELDPDSTIIAEVWNKPNEVVPMMLGTSADSAMNYRFTAALLNDWDHNHVGNDPEHQGFMLNEDMTSDEFWGKIEDIEKDYPEEGFLALMNLAGSHDTARPLYYFKGDVNKQKMLSFIQFTFPGAPTLFYGDEAGATNRASTCREDRPLSDDPFMRVTYPWGNENRELIGWYQNLSTLRSEHSFLRTGELVPLYPDGGERTLAYLRYDANGTALLLANAQDEPAGITLDLTGFVPDGWLLDHSDSFSDSFSDEMVIDGKVTLTLAPYETRAFILEGVSRVNAKTLVVEAHNEPGIGVGLHWAGNDAVIIKRNLDTGEVFTFTVTVAGSSGYVDSTARKGYSYEYEVHLLHNNLLTGIGRSTVKIPGSEPPEPVLKEEKEPAQTPGKKKFEITISDIAGDDWGPGTYEYPMDAVFKPGDFDLLNFSLLSGADDYTLVFDLTNLDNCWGSPNGLSKVTYFFILDNQKDEGTTQGIKGTNVGFADDFRWDAGLQIEGWESKLYIVESGKIASNSIKGTGIMIEGMEGNPGKVVVTIPKEVLGDIDDQSRIAVWTCGQDGYGANRIRDTNLKRSQWRFGGGSDGGNDPNIMDLLVPKEMGCRQEKILNWETHPVVIPGIPLRYYLQLEAL